MKITLKTTLFNICVIQEYNFGDMVIEQLTRFINSLTRWWMKLTDSL